MGCGPQVGPFPSRPIMGSIRGEGTPPQTLAVIWRKKGVLSLSSGCSRKAGEGVQPPSPPPPPYAFVPPPRRPPPLLPPATVLLRCHRVAAVLKLPPPPLPQAAAASGPPCRHPLLHRHPLHAPLPSSLHCQAPSAASSPDFPLPSPANSPLPNISVTFPPPLHNVQRPPPRPRLNPFAAHLPPPWNLRFPTPEYPLFPPEISLFHSRIPAHPLSSPLPIPAYLPDFPFCFQFHYPVRSIPDVPPPFQSIAHCRQPSLPLSCQIPVIATPPPEIRSPTAVYAEVDSSTPEIPVNATLVVPRFPSTSPPFLPSSIPWHPNFTHRTINPPLALIPILFTTLPILEFLPVQRSLLLPKFLSLLLVIPLSIPSPSRSSFPHAVPAHPLPISHPNLTSFQLLIFSRNPAHRRNHFRRVLASRGIPSSAESQLPQNTIGHETNIILPLRGTQVALAPSIPAITQPTSLSAWVHPSRIHPFANSHREFTPHEFFAQLISLLDTRPQCRILPPALSNSLSLLRNLASPRTPQIGDSSAPISAEFLSSTELTLVESRCSPWGIPLSPRSVNVLPPHPVEIMHVPQNPRPRRLRRARLRIRVMPRWLLRVTVDSATPSHCHLRPEGGVKPQRSDLWPPWILTPALPLRGPTHPAHAHTHCAYPAPCKLTTRARYVSSARGTSGSRVQPAVSLRPNEGLSRSAHCPSALLLTILLYPVHVARHTAPASHSMSRRQHWFTITPYFLSRRDLLRPRHRRLGHPPADRPFKQHTNDLPRHDWPGSRPAG